MGESHATIETSARPSAGAAYFADHVRASRATPLSEIDALLSALRAGSDAWIRLPVSERIAVLDEVRNGMLAG